MPGPLASLYSVLGIDARQVDAGLTAAENAVKGFTQLKPEVTLGADDSQLKTNISSAGKVVDGFDGQMAIARLDADDSAAKSAIGEAQKALSAFDGESAQAKIGVDDSAKSVIVDATRVVDAFDGKTAKAKLSADTGNLLDDVQAAVRKLDAFDTENAVKLGLDDSELRSGLKEADALLRKVAGQEKQLLRLGIDSGPLVNDLKQAEEDIKESARRAAGTVETEMEAAGEAGGKSFLSMSTVAKGAFAGLGATAGAAAGSFISQTNDIGDAMALVKARMGEANAESGNFEQRLKDIHNANYGADYGEIAAGLADVQTQLHLTGGDADYFLEKSFAIRDTWGKEINETLLASRPLMQNFGLDGKQALDIITAGLQSGVDNGDDFIDTLQEYSVVFRDMGYDAIDFVDILTAGMEAGARNSDQIADAVKEFDIRIRDGSASTQAAIKGLGIDYAGFIKQLGDGSLSGRQAMELINDKLREVGDTTKQEQLGVALWGTKWEDAGGQVILSLDNAQGAVQDLGITVDGAADRMDKAIYSGPTSAFEALQRQIGGVINDTTGKLLPVLKDIAPIFAGFGPIMTKAFGAISGSAIGLALSDKVREGFKTLIAKVLPSAIEAGTVTGAAQGEAQAAAATGPGILSRMVASIAGMQIPLAASGTTVGTAVGTALTAGIAAGMVLGGPALLVAMPYIFDRIGGQDIQSKLSHIGTDAANAYATGFSEEVKGKFATVVQSTFDQAIASGAAAQAAADLAEAAGKAFLAQYETTLADANMAAIVAHNISERADAQDFEGIGEQVGEKVGTGFASANWDHAAYLASLTLSSTFPVAPGWIAAGEKAAEKTGEAFANAPWDHYAFLAGLTVSSAFAVAPGWIQAAEKAREKVSDEFVAGNDWTSAGNAAGQKTSSALASGILDNRSGPKDAWQQYLHDMKTMLDPMKEIAWLNGKLTGKRLADGLNSTDPLKRQAAQNTYDILKQRLDDLGALGYKTGTDAGEGVADGIRKKKGAVVTATDAIKTGVENKLDSIKTDIGRLTISPPTNVGNIVRYINGVLSGIHTNIKINVGTGRFNPFPEGAGHGGRRALGGPVSANTMYQVAEGGIPEMLRMGGKSFLLMGAVGGYVERINKAMSGFSATPTPVAARGGGGVNINIHINGNQYGGRAGLRDLAREIENAVRQGTRGGGWQVGR